MLECCHWPLVSLKFWKLESVVLRVPKPLCERPSVAGSCSLQCDPSLNSAVPGGVNVSVSIGVQNMQVVSLCTSHTVLVVSSILTYVWGQIAVDLHDSAILADLALAQNTMFVIGSEILGYRAGCFKVAIDPIDMIHVQGGEVFAKLKFLGQAGFTLGALGQV